MRFFPVAALSVLLAVACTANNSDSTPLSFSVTTVSLDAAGHEVTFVAHTKEGTWHVTPSASWLHVSPESGSGIVNVSVSADANELEYERTALLEFTMPDGFNGVMALPVTQAAGNGESGGGGGEGALQADVTTLAPTGLTSNGATLNGSCENATATVRETGFEWGRGGESGTTVQATGTTRFSASLNELTPETLYWVRAYVILQRNDEIEYIYGKSITFTTPSHTAPPISSGAPVWAELPVMDVQQKDGYIVSASDENIYYAWHMTDVNGPGGRKARNYTTCFSAETHVALWVAAPLHQMYRSGVTRQDSYANDPDVPASIQYSAPKSGGSGCNKGHILGSSDRLASRLTNQQVFYSTNIAPQLSNFNTGGAGWNTVEDWVDTRLCSDTLYVVIGTYYKTFSDKWGYTVEPGLISYGGRDDVAFPTMFYYALLRTKSGSSGKAVQNCTRDELQCVAVVRAHTNSLKSRIDNLKARGDKEPYVYTEDLMSVSDLEKLTGFSYFPNVPNAPKDSYDAAEWGITKSINRN